MYTHDCKGQNCVTCKQVSEGQNVASEKPSLFKKTIEDLIANDMFDATPRKAACFSACKQIKSEIHFKINRLINILREREEELCDRVEKECCDEMTRIDHDATGRWINKILQKNNEPERSPFEARLSFDSEFELVSNLLKTFGHLIYKDPVHKIMVERSVKFLELSQKLEEMETSMKMHTELSPSTVPPSKTETNDITASSLEFKENGIEKDLMKIPSECFSVSPSLLQKAFEDDVTSNFTESNKELEESCSSDDDLEVISSSEASSIPTEFSFSPPLPSKQRFKFNRKRSCFGSLLSKKGNVSPLSTESSSCSKSKMQECITALEDLVMHPKVKKIQAVDEQVSQNSSSEWSDDLSPEKSCSVIGKDIKKLQLQQNSTASKSMEEKELSSFDRQAEAKHLCECIAEPDSSEAHDLSSALLATFKKYLKKNPKEEWLSTVENSKKSISSEGQCICDQRLSKNNLPKEMSDWLYTPPV